MHGLPLKRTAELLFASCLAVAVASPVAADKPVAQSAAGQNEVVRQAASRAIRLIERSSTEILKHRQCSTCHHQTLSLIVFDEARKVGLDFDEKVFHSQLTRVRDYHKSRFEGYAAGKDNGEQVHTPGYGLWGLDVAGHKPDELTEAMVGYLLNYQQNIGHWLVGLDRRPAEASHLTTNYLAIRAVNRFGVAHQKDRIAARRKAVKKWLATAEIRDTEDEVFRLRLADELDVDAADLQPLVEQLASKQRDDGGWAQTEELTSDAYATGSVLVALHGGRRRFVLLLP